MALFLRRTYYLYRGEVGRAQEAEDRFDDMAARVGSRWVADMASVAEIVPYHLSGDVLGLKRALHRIDRLVPIAPNLAVQRETIRAMYEGHRGRPDRALAIYASLEADLMPFCTQGWAAARAHQAECLNAIGRHADALAICEQARAQLTQADRAYVFAYQQLERESAHALAGLGRLDEASSLAERLLAECAGHDNPLALGLLHHDRARIACVARDRQAFERHFHAAREAFTATANPALITKIRRLQERGIAASLLVGGSRAASALERDDLSLLERERAEQVLGEAVRLLQPGAASLYLVVRGRAALVARHGNPTPCPSVRSKLAELLSSESRRSRESGIQTLPGATAKIVPLVTHPEEPPGTLVGLLVLEHCYESAALSALDVEELAALLQGDDDGETATLPV
jgi:tetratricopeptide (TPR) repeat protein